MRLEALLVLVAMRNTTASFVSFMVNTTGS
jgi:hypothetical protein